MTNADKCQKSVMMSVRILFSKFPKNIIERTICNASLVQINSRRFSRKLNKDEKSYKPVKPRKTVQEGKM